MNDFKRSALRPFVFLCKARPVFGANINVEKTAAILNVMFFWVSVSKWNPIMSGTLYKRQFYSIQVQMIKCSRTQVYWVFFSYPEQHNWIWLTDWHYCVLWSPWCLCDRFCVFTKQWNVSIAQCWAHHRRLLSVLCCSTSYLKESDWCVKCVFCNNKYSSLSAMEPRRDYANHNIVDKGYKG